MTIAVGVFNVILGLVYCQYGTMTLIDMRRQWRTMGFSHFGAAWIAMAFTCGPHHFVHGLHLLIAHGRAGPLDLVAVVIGFPAGVIWFALRVEAFAGGAGDRFIKGTPVWILALPALASAYAATIVTVVVDGGHFRGDQLAAVAPNLLLVAIYVTIGYYLARTQLANRRPLGGWSVSRAGAGRDLPHLRDDARRLRLLRRQRALSGRVAHDGDRLASSAGWGVLLVGGAVSVSRRIPGLEPRGGDARGGADVIEMPYGMPRVAADDAGEPDLALTVAMLAFASGIVHLALVVPHLRESAVLAVLFALAGVAEIVWSVLLVVRRTPPLEALGFGLLVSIVAAWFVSRTAGLPFSGREPFSLLDSLTSGCEVVAALAITRLRRPSAALTYLGATLAVLLLLTLATVGHHALT